MLKTFTLTSKTQEKMSETDGTMVFHLEDENGFKRQVKGNTTLDITGNAISISATHPREHPLIQCLFLTDINEEINIDFTQYNDVFERKEEVKVATAEDIEKIAKEMQSKPMRVGSLLKSTEVKYTESIS